MSEIREEASREWFREWFGRTYLDLYPHRDAEEAKLAVKLFGRLAELRPGERVLDLACGAGRHLAPLRRLGVRPVGLDLSAVLLARVANVEDRGAGAISRRAETREGEPGGGAEERPMLVRGDMRWLPFADGSFGGVVSFFTSFGYFERREDDDQVVVEIRRVLRPGGSYLLDFLNAEKVMHELVAEDVREVQGRRVRQIRTIENDQVIKRIEISVPGESHPPEVFFERVRLYSAEALTGLLAGHGLRPHAHLGDYEGELFRPGSERLLISGRAE